MSWELGGQIGMQIWRFVGNMILTRLVVPEAFGVLGLAQVIIMGLTLFSDIGLRSSVIHHPRSREPEFLDTVWTISFIRGWILWFVSCLLAWPFAHFYNMPEMLWVVPVIGFACVIRGMASTSVLTARRDLKNYWSVWVDSGSRILGTTATVLLAFWIPSAMALALGWIMTAFAFTGLSYAARGIRWHRFCWEPAALTSLVSFGRWVMATGCVAILQERGDRLALGKALTATELGNYVIGSNLAAIPMTLISTLQDGIVQPLYARLRHEPPDKLRSKMRRLRLVIMAGIMPPLVLLVVISKPLVLLLYSPAYEMAGYFCQLACLAVLYRLSTEVGSILLAVGDAASHFRLTLARAASVVAGMCIGAAVGNAWGNAGAGLLFGYAFGPILIYPYQAMLYRRLNAWFPEVDTLGLGITAAVAFAMAFGQI
jgi:O-antigen/teichoic acid export membrane protein